MRVTNLAFITLGELPSGYCAITGASDNGPLQYQVTSSNGLQVSGQLGFREYADFTPQGDGPYTASLTYPNQEVGPIEVSDIKSPDADLAVVYVVPSGGSSSQTINGPYAWVSNQQSK